MGGLMPGPSVFYLRQDFPYPHWLSYTLATFLLQEPEEDLRRIASGLDDFDGYLSQSNRRAILNELISQTEKIPQYESLFKLVGHYIDRPNAADEILTSLRYAKGMDDDDDGRPLAITNDERTELKRRLELVLRRYPGLRRQNKAERLSVATGLSVDSVDLICDLRPVFSEDRTEVQGLIPLTTLKVVASGVDRFPISFEAILSARDVQRLFDIAEKAVAKLNTLGNFAAEAKQTIPLVDLTKTGE